MKLIEISNIRKQQHQHVLNKREHIKNWLVARKIQKWKINDDLTVDVDGSVHLQAMDWSSKSKFRTHYAGELPQIRQLPCQFNRVNGIFSIANNKLTSLYGLPHHITGGENWIDFSGNMLTSLAGIHKVIKTMLNDGQIYMDRNPIKNSILGLLLIKGLARVEFYGPMDRAFDIVNEYLSYEGEKRDVLACQQELIEAGLEPFARL